MKQRGKNGRAAVQLRLADRKDVDKARQLAYYHRGFIKAKFHLVDLPDVLAAGFVDHLERMKSLAQTHDFAFADEIAPKDAEGSETRVPEPPPTIEYDLSCLRNSSSKESMMRKVFTPESRDNVIGFLQQNTTLDDGQAVALFDNLSRKIAFTQGPPGTGKTFLGAAECEVILNSQDPDDRKPIVVVCMTNHALDDFIGSLLARKIGKVARIGGRSTQEWIKPLLLKSHALRTGLSCQDQHQNWEMRMQVEGLVKEGTEWTRALSESMVGWAVIADHLRLHYPTVFLHFSTVEQTNTNLMSLRDICHWSGFAFDYWLSGGDILDVDSLLESVAGMMGSPTNLKATLRAQKEFFAEILDNATKAAKRRELEVWSLDLEERRQLHAKWIDEISLQRLCEMMAEIHRRHQAAILRQQELRWKIDKKVIEFQKIDIIGLTSTGCAKYWGLLKSIEPRVILFEESSELIESHSLCALVPSVKHAIQIGDPLQLRPHVQQMALTTERDDRYRLDESLFERMMKTTMEYSKLHIQRRAHPDLADLLRVGDYVYLEDHPCTASHPSVPGMSKRLFWLDHKQSEDQPDPRSPMAKSFSNAYEVESIAAFVQYLIERQGYKYGKITVLTPYNGQLAALAKRFSQHCSVHLTKEDRESLEDAEVLQEAIGNGSIRDRVPLASMITLATIDNYQGEENDVVILSTVRSRGKLGFMKNRNRINVAISRAHNGFYVFGNASLMMDSDHWSAIIDVFKKRQAIGTSFPVISCSEHDGLMTLVQSPKDFQEVPHCQHVCTETLGCGHICHQLCHPLEMHADGRVTCSELCGRNLPCGHTCKDPCGKRCGPCQQELEMIKLECGHDFLPRCSTTEPKCDFTVSKTPLECGHEKVVKCHEQDTADVCVEKCSHNLPCGHPCRGKCSECSSSGAHQPCTATCGKLLSCLHQCLATCHEGDCPLCNQECKKSCQHGPCSMPCRVVCDPCVKAKAITGCEHDEGQSWLCCFPDSSLPCSEPCTRLLPCMLHICPGLCGETCLPSCRECEGITATIPMVTLQCQHTFSVKELDALFKLGKVYEIQSNGAIVSGAVQQIPSKDDLVCPTCSGPALGTRRYDLNYRLGDIHDTIDRLYAKCGRHMARLMEDTKRVDILLFGNMEQFFSALRSGHLAFQSNDKRITQRGLPTNEIQKTAERFRDEVVEPVENAIVELSTMLGNSIMFPVPALPFKLRFDKIYFRCRFMRIELSLQVICYLQKLPESRDNILIMSSLRGWVETESRVVLEELQIRITQCEFSNLKRLEVEFRIVQLSFASGLRFLGIDDRMQVNTSLNRIDEVCHAYPYSAGLLLRSVTYLKECVRGNVFPSKLDDMWDSRSASLWQKWGKHKIGSLVYCAYSHPYSSQSFPDGCPECGKTRAVEKAEEADARSFLATHDQFMEYVKTLRL